MTNVNHALRSSNCDQHAVGLARKSDETITGWMPGDEPDNAQPKSGGGYGPPIAPETVVERYRKMRDADPSRLVLLNLGQGGPRDGIGEVLGESRSIPVRDGRIADEFKPYEARLYRIEQPGRTAEDHLILRNVLGRNHSQREQSGR